MTLRAFLDELWDRDVRVWTEGDRLRCNAPPGILTPTLRRELEKRRGDIVAFLRLSDTMARQQRAIVPLQPRGSRLPIFAVPGHNGDVFCYRALAHALGDGQPFFGLEPPGVHERAPLDTVEGLAAHFYDQIRAFHAGGSCIVAGYCAGGTVAFELARQLVTRGVAVPFVALLAAPHPTWFRALPQLTARSAETWSRVQAHFRALVSPPAAGRARHFVALARRGGEAALATLEGRRDPVLSRRRKVEATTLSAIRRYEPGRLDTVLCLLSPGAAWIGAEYATDLWRGLARRTEEYPGPAVGRDAFLRNPNVSAVAEALRRCGERWAPLPSDGWAAPASG